MAVRCKAPPLRCTGVPGVSRQCTRVLPSTWAQGEQLLPALRQCTWRFLCIPDTIFSVGGCIVIEGFQSHVRGRIRALWGEREYNKATCMLS
jgi:hypothetical protein